MDALFHDLRYALRTLAQRPAFTLGVVLTLGLGIGANVTMFSVVDRMLFRPPPLLRDPGLTHRVYLVTTYQGREFASNTVQYARYLDLMNWTTSFARTAAFAEEDLAVGGGADTREMRVGIVSAGFFGFFDAPPAIGRYFTASEDSPPNGTAVVVLDYGFWETRYNGRDDVLGTTLQIGPTAYTIIGVAPRGFVGLWPNQRPVAFIPITSYAAAMAVGKHFGSESWWTTYTWRWSFYQQLTDRIGTLPGVSDVGAISLIPLVPQASATRFTVVGRPEPKPGEWTSADIRTVDPGYFATMRIPLVRGRTFTAADRTDAPPVIVVNETMARQFWPGSDPIGERLQVNWTDPKAQPEIVGVVGDVRTSSLDADIRPMIYYVGAQAPTGSMTLAIRHSGDTGPLVAAVRAAVRDLDRDVPLTDVATMSTRLSRSMADRRYPMLLLSGFAVLAVLLAAIGLYGLLSYVVSRRTREIGVRMALGADALAVLRMLLRDGVRLTLIGVAAGTVASIAAARALGHLLYGVGPTDPLTFAAVGLLLVLVATIASYLPAARATRVDPVEALRTE